MISLPCIIDIVFERAKKYLPFIEKNESFLVIEILNKFIRITSLIVNFPAKKLKVDNCLIANHKLENQIAALGLVKGLLNKFGRLDKYKIIASLDSSLATTVHRSVVLNRDNYKSQIDEADLNNKIAQGIWKLFDKGRGEAAAKMGVSDLDVTLTDVRVKSISLDGHKVSNPLGFKAHTIGIQFCQTFNPRSFIFELKKIIPADRLVFITENGSAVSDVLTKIGKDNFLLIDLLRDKTSVFLTKDRSIFYLSSFPWGKDNLLSSIKEAFSVSSNVAEKIFRIYLTKNASPTFLKSIEKLLSEKFMDFADLISNTCKASSPPLLYLISSFSLPEFVLNSGIRTNMKRKLKFKLAHHGFIGEHFDFNLELDENLARNNQLPALSAFLGFYFLPSDDNINKIAKRHARWLIIQ